MNPPYPLPSENRAVFCMGKTDVPVRELKPGEAGRFRYSFVVPDDFTGESDQRKLWVMGRILFRDRLKTHRAVFFARNYDFARANFRRSKHSEYECEE